MNIYELHFGSWKKPSEEEEDWYSYTELADILLPYLKENGYNYLEIMPLSEHLAMNPGDTRIPVSTAPPPGTEPPRN